MGYIFAHVDRVQWSYEFRLKRFCQALRRKSLTPIALYRWWKDILDGDPELIYVTQERRSLLDIIVKRLAPEVYVTAKFMEAESERALKEKALGNGGISLAGPVRP